MSSHKLLVGNPENIDISKKKIEYTFQYDFLGDSIPDTITTLYYKQLCQVSAFKLKNIYQFLFLRSVQLHKLYEIFPHMENNNTQHDTQDVDNSVIGEKHYMQHYIKKRNIIDILNYRGKYGEIFNKFTNRDKIDILVKMLNEIDRPKSEVSRVLMDCITKCTVYTQIKEFWINYHTSRGDNEPIVGGNILIYHVLHPRNFISK